MIVEVVSAYHDEDTNRLEVVKEIVDNDGNVSYALHIIPTNALNVFGAMHDIDDPDEVLDLVLYEPHLSLDDEASTLTERIAKCKNRLADKTNNQARKENRKQNMERKNLPARYLPIDGIRPLDIVKLAGRVSKENIVAKRAELRAPKEEKGNDRPAKQRPDREGRSQPSRADILLGIAPRRR